jgi:transposase
MDKKFSIKQFNERFPDNDACLEEIKQLRFGYELACPKCTKENKFYRMTGRSAYACAYCGHHIYPLKASIFDHPAPSLNPGSTLSILWHKPELESAPSNLNEN